MSVLKTEFDIFYCACTSTYTFLFLWCDLKKNLTANQIDLVLKKQGLDKNNWNFVHKYASIFNSTTVFLWIDQHLITLYGWSISHGFRMGMRC